MILLGVVIDVVVFVVGIDVAVVRSVVVSSSFPLCAKLLACLIKIYHDSMIPKQYIHNLAIAEIEPSIYQYWHPNFN